MMITHPNNLVIIGGSGSIGQAMTRQFSHHYPKAKIHVFSRHIEQISLHRIESENISIQCINYNDEQSIAFCAELAAKKAPIDCVFIASGLLHDTNLMPEKSLSELSASNFQTLFAANTITPALLAKHFVPKLNSQKISIFAALSARVGSVSDNRLGGWYAYRAAKAALNMILKNTAIETARRNKKAIIVGLHPGTVDSQLSKPFQRNVPADKLFTPDYSASQLIQVMQQLTVKDSGKCFAWNGEEIQP